jgi:hypothetical protein
VRRGSIAAALLGAVALMMSGCGRPPGVDGNLTNNWPAMPEAKVPVPADHACYRVFGTNPDLFSQPRDPVDCTAQHEVETVHVGTFSGADANRDSPPPAGGPVRRKAYEDCAASARTFLGDDWRTGRLWLYLTVPQDKHWQAGARWYRCDLVAFRDVDGHLPDVPTGSLRGALSGARPYGVGCLKVTVANGAVQSMVAADCATAHNGEFAGVYEAPDTPYPSDAGARSAMSNKGCLSTIAKFAGVPDDANVRYRTGYITYGFGAPQWALGNRGVRCYMWRSDKTFTRSLKGAGTGVLPINT